MRSVPHPLVQGLLPTINQRCHRRKLINRQAKQKVRKQNIRIPTVVIVDQDTDLVTSSG